MNPRALAALLGIVVLGWMSPVLAEPLPPTTVPPTEVITLDDANRTLKKDLDLRYQVLSTRFQTWKKRADAFNQKYAGKDFEEESQDAKDGAKEQAWLLQEGDDYSRAAALFASDVRRLSIDRSRRIAEMNAMAKKLGWKQKERTRLDTALHALALDGDANATVETIRRNWSLVEARGQDAELAQEAGKGRGAGLPGAGTQSFEDCTIFALANAGGVPYGVVAARAAELIRHGVWRGAADREDPNQVIERHGLNGDEVIMLTEALGQAEVVPSSQFRTTLEEGRPILVCVTVVDADGNDFLHEVVLTRSFKHAGEDWYEMLDSNQDPQQRRYWSAAELRTVLHENGVAYRPEPGTVPQLLRPADGK